MFSSRSGINCRKKYIQKVFEKVAYKMFVIMSQLDFIIVIQLF